MRYAVLLVLPLLCLIGGCQSLTQDAVAVEYRPGTNPTTIAGKCYATYTLHSIEPDVQFAPTTIELGKGAMVGFRREPDGSLVAIAGWQNDPDPGGPVVAIYTHAIDTVGPVCRQTRTRVRTPLK